jgi:hypothetical protein
VAACRQLHRVLVLLRRPPRHVSGVGRRQRVPRADQAAGLARPRRYWPWWALLTAGGVGLFELERCGAVTALVAWVQCTSMPVCVSSRRWVEAGKRLRRVYSYDSWRWRWMVLEHVDRCGGIRSGRQSCYYGARPTTCAWQTAHSLSHAHLRRRLALGPGNALQMAPACRGSHFPTNMTLLRTSSRRSPHKPSSTRVAGIKDVHFTDHAGPRTAHLDSRQ